LKKDYKLSSSIKGNKKSSYKRLNCKPVNKKNLEYYKCSKKDYFKSECYSKLKDRIDYKNVWYYKIEYFKNRNSSDSEIEKINFNHQKIWIHNQKYNAAQDLW